MIKKRLDTTNIANELEGASLFFTKSSPPLPPQEPKTTYSTLTASPSPKPKQVQKEQVPTKRHIDNPVPTVKPKSMLASNNASMHASSQPLTHETIIETIRKAVKDVGKDSATYRFTPEEKKALLELSFSYKVQGYKTSENELIRIAINFMLEDQKQNGRNSVLQGVLDALRQ